MKVTSTFAELYRAAFIIYASTFDVDMEAMSLKSARSEFKFCLRFLLAE